ncbi:uncharacterized protein LOC141852816 [Brevipalpus obovatus]|uniref:uncharacterized protein LOC141852816 n=1 Tax=Brevipalpus obovatus TaxID=246614 RepID=UPI003D9F3317
MIQSSNLLSGNNQCNRSFLNRQHFGGSFNMSFPVPEDQFRMISTSCSGYWKNYQRSTEWLRQHGNLSINLPFPWMYSDVFGDTSISQDDDPSSRLTNNNMESTEDVDENYARFIMKTREHQKNRAKKKAEKRRKERANPIVYVDLGKADLDEMKKKLYQKSLETTVDKNLYDLENASRIKEIESILLQGFNQFCNEREAKLWPNIPINIK